MLVVSLSDVVRTQPMVLILILRFITRLTITPTFSADFKITSFIKNSGKVFVSNSYIFRVLTVCFHIPYTAAGCIEPVPIIKLYGLFTY